MSTTVETWYAALSFYIQAQDFNSAADGQYATINQAAGGFLIFNDPGADLPAATCILDPTSLILSCGEQPMTVNS